MATKSNKNFVSLHKWLCIVNTVVIEFYKDGYAKCKGGYGI